MFCQEHYVSLTANKFQISEEVRRVIATDGGAIHCTCLVGKFLWSNLTNQEFWPSILHQW